MSFAIWYTLLPNTAGIEIFKIQLQTIININRITGNFTNSMTGFSMIFSNNLRILFLCVIFSFFYGAGAIYILAWNASVMGAAIGNSIRSAIAKSVTSLTWLSYFSTVSTKFAAYFLHGIPEVGAFFFGGLAGGIISIAISNHDMGSGRFRKLVKDAAALCAIAVAMLVIAALIEVTISPHFL